MTLRNPTETIIAQAITSAIDGVLAKSQHELRGLLRDFCETTAGAFIQLQQKRTTQIFEEDGKDDVSESLGANRNHDQTQVHALKDSHDQVRDFVGAPIYDDYGYESFREPRLNSEVTTQEGDSSSQIHLLSPINIHEINNDITKETLLDRPIFTSDVESYYVPVTNLTDGPIYDVSDDGVFTESYYYKDTPCSDDDQVQGVNDRDDAYIGVRKQYRNFVLGEKNCHRESHREPPDRDGNKGHTYADLVDTQKGLTSGSKYTKLLDEREHILKLEHDQEDRLKELSVIERHALEDKITYLREALGLEMEKNRILEHKLKETHKQIRMLNKGSTTLDKILSMGRTEKSTMGLGYQGDSSSSETVFVLDKFVEQNKTRVALDAEYSCVAMSGPSKWLNAKEDSETEKLHSVINADPTSLTKDINLTISTYFCGTHSTLSLMEETMDLVMPNKEIGNLSYPLCRFKSAMFRSGSKLFGEARLVDVMFVIYPMSSTCLVYFSKASLQTSVILGADVSYSHHHHVCALMHLDVLFVGKRKQKIQVKWMFLMGSVVFYVGDLMVIQKHVQVKIITCLVMFTKSLCLGFFSRWKHVDLNGRPEVFDMIHFVWVFGAYNTVTSLGLPRSTASWSLCIHMNIVYLYGILRSSAVWPLSHVDVTVPLAILPSQWLQMELQWGVSKKKVEVLHSSHTGLGCIFMAIICWNNIACESSNLWESSNSAFQHACKAATYFLTLSVLPSASTKFSMVMWTMTRSVGRELICGVMINVFKSRQQLPYKSICKILFHDVTRCAFLVGWKPDPSGCSLL